MAQFPISLCYCRSIYELCILFNDSMLMSMIINQLYSQVGNCSKQLELLANMLDFVWPPIGFSHFYEVFGHL